MTKFCISLPDRPQPASSYRFLATPEPMALQMKDSENPEIFESLEATLNFIEENGIKKPGNGIEIREYFGRSIYVYEIASYGTLRSFANHLDLDSEIIDLIQENLDEEGSADKKLTKIAEGTIFSSGINAEAADFQHK